MATGIVSTAALGTLGLLAGSLNSSVEGSLKSRAVVIAQDLFHDLQIGALSVTPAPTDQRQTYSLRPQMGFAFAKHVLFFDSAGMLLPDNQPAEGSSQEVYEQGTPLPQVEWLVCIEGTQSAAFTNSTGSGQITSVSDTASVSPLGSPLYPFQGVTGSSDPTVTPPPTALTQVRISVESPASATEKSRKKFSYEFLWNR